MIAWWMTPCGSHLNLVVGHREGTTLTMVAPCPLETSVLPVLMTTATCRLHEEDVIRLKVAGALRVTRKAWGDPRHRTLVAFQAVEVDAVVESHS